MIRSWLMIRSSNFHPAAACSKILDFKDMSHPIQLRFSRKRNRKAENSHQMKSNETKKLPETELELNTVSEEQKFITSPGTYFETTKISLMIRSWRLSVASLISKLNKG